MHTVVVQRQLSTGAAIQDTVLTATHLNGQAADSKRMPAVYRCRLQIDQLKYIDHPDIKLCKQRARKVFKVTDFDRIERAVAARGCM